MSLLVALWQNVPQWLDDTSAPGARRPGELGWGDDAVLSIHVLGPMEFWVDGTQHSLGSVKERCVLAVLLSAEGAAVSTDTMISRVWDDEPPITSVETLRSYVSRLRNRLRAAGDGVRLSSDSRTYRLLVDADAVDFRRVRRLSEQAGATEDPAVAADLLRAAEQLWRGQPFAGLPGLWLESMRGKLKEQRRQIRERRIHLELGLGRHAEVVGELRDLAARHPVAEPVVADLMLALYRCGRYSEALETYRRTRARLSTELGADPGPDLQRLHTRLLHRDPALSVPAQARRESRVRALPAGPAPATAPDTLLRDTRHFIGRTAELARLLREDDIGTALPITVISGLAGVGKTCLAIHAAHRMRASYPDGRLYLNLHAHDPHESPIEPTEALGSLLISMGMPAQHLALTRDLRAAQWRREMADRRALIVLDDVRDAAQVRLLLPGSPSCRVLVTSRRRLTDLEGAGSLSLDVPDTADAAALFTRIAEESRRLDDADRALVDEIVNRCGNHPLAVQLTANRFRHRAWRVRDLAARLAEAPRRLDVIDAPPGISMAFDLSYAELGPAARSVFRRLALHPGPDPSWPAAVAVCGLGADETRRGIDELVEAHLLDEPAHDRYRFHDLVHDFALHTAHREEPDRERADAVGRVLDLYLDLADQADRLAYPHGRRSGLVPVPAHRAQAPFTTAEEAEEWLGRERSNLVAATRLAGTESPEHIRFLPEVLTRSLLQWGSWEIARDLYTTSLAAWRRAGIREPGAETHLLIERASIQWRLGAHEAAFADGAEALALAEDAKDLRGQAEALAELGATHVRAGRFTAALHHLDRALAVHREIDNPHGRAGILLHLAVALGHLRKYEQATSRLFTARDIYESLGERRELAKILNNIGELYFLQNDFDNAERYYLESLEVARRSNSRAEFAILTNNLGQVLLARGDPVGALERYAQALDIYREISDLRCEADTQINSGLARLAMGAPREALAHFGQGRAIAERIGDVLHRQRAAAGFARAHLDLGDPAGARAAYRTSAELAHEMGTELEEAHALAGLARTTETLDGALAARPFWSSALALYERLGAAEAEEARNALADPDGP
ncbi:BTAD domain-containing putative transcriptional regulator [Embleya sp. NPDC008237]|uniref:AfsR/SARP family transcriptional regulator n=1 Tax=Embleya sp. NPDC008237 TaxID=3363978 RepID=UPI0036E5AB51